MTELQRLAMQMDPSFGDQLSRRGPRILDWASLASCGAKASAPRLALEGFWNADAPIAKWLHGGLALVGMRNRIAQALADRLGSHEHPPLAVRGGLLLMAAPKVPPSMSFGIGLGGRTEWSADGEVTVNTKTRKAKHATLHLASADKRTEGTLRVQGTSTSLFVFRAIGRSPLWHLPVPALAELHALGGSNPRERWRQRLAAAAEVRDFIQRGRETRLPYVRVGLGITIHREPFPRAVPLGGVSAEITKRTSVAFHTDILHRTCTTVTSALTESLTGVARLRCNLISFAETTLDFGLEYLWTPPPTVQETEWAKVKYAANASAFTDHADNGTAEDVGLPLTPKSAAREARQRRDALLRPDPALVAFRASLVSDRLAVGLTADNALLTLSRAVGRFADGPSDVSWTVLDKVLRRISGDLRAVANVLGPLRVTTGFTTELRSYLTNVGERTTPRFVFVMSL
jgi:hypothetical protein